MQDSLNVLWYVFSAAWLAYLAFVLLISSQQRQIWTKIRDIRARLAGVAKH